MYNKYQFIKTSTAGNRTGFLIGKSAYRDRNRAINTLLRKLNLEAEQYSFIWQTPGNNCVMNMAGGELCGGALLATPSLLGKFTGNTTITTAGRQLVATVTDRGQNLMYVKTTLPYSIVKDPAKRITVAVGRKIEGYKIILDGIAYFVTKEPLPRRKTRSLFAKLDRELDTRDAPSIGTIEILEGNRIVPTIWIKAIDTITSEQGCTTGSLSAQLAFPLKNGYWIQPSGELIRIGQTPGGIEIEAGVELLSDGYVYLNDQSVG